MIKFILNNEEINTSLPSGTVLLDFLRREKYLTGTKTGCREGDCGACTILVGKIIDNKLSYEALTSCLMPLGNANGKHIVSIEGINLTDLSPIQQNIVDTGATQCGFCTVGFVMSLTGYCLHDTVNYTTENAVAAIDGNICRCTGYKSLQKAAANINEIITHKDKTDNINWLVENKFLPNYFTTIKQRLQKLNEVHSSQNTMQQKSIFVGGGTDLFVQKPEDMVEHEINHVADDNELKALSFDKGICTLGAATTVETLKQSATFQSYFPRIHEFLKLVSSTPIRNMATIAGNFVNASPIGDMTVFFLALDANISLQNQQGTTRTISLKSFYKGYKMMDKKEGEYIKSISFKLPTDNSLFNFEKVSKRTHLDIASVNTALQIKIDKNIITEVHLSAGGVSAIPLYCHKTVEFLKGKALTNQTVLEANEILQTEIAPISDARGTSDYKRLLLRQLFFAHFLQLFPNIITEEVVLYDRINS